MLNKDILSVTPEFDDNFCMLLPKQAAQCSTLLYPLQQVVRTTI